MTTPNLDLRAAVRLQAPRRTAITKRQDQQAGYPRLSSVLKHDQTISSITTDLSCQCWQRSVSHEHRKAEPVDDSRAPLGAEYLSV